jgi:hypothetical protein
MVPDLAVDDIGQETGVGAFGQHVAAIKALVEDRYVLFTKGGVRLHLTTNLLPGELLERYKQPVVDRLHEMCIWITFSGASRRRGLDATCL